MTRSFHLSFVVPDKEAAKEFYLDILGCSLGRDNKTWFDVLFFGHQLTIHQSSPQRSAFTIDHFGPIISKDKWLSIAESCVNHNVSFVMRPTIKDEGKSTESGKFLINDSAGNLLEFKYYQSFAETVA